jgi:hypothetical protein
VSDKLFAEPFVNIGGKQKYTVLVSIGAHTLIIAAAIIVPVVATDTFVMPARFGTIAFTTSPPLPPSPPPPRGATQEQPSVTSSLAPVVAPQQISSESSIQLTTAPVVGFDSAGLVRGTITLLTGGACPRRPRSSSCADRRTSSLLKVRMRCLSIHRLPCCASEAS